MKTKSGHLFIGGVFEDPQTRRLVYVEEGAFERGGRVSNHWTLREIEKDGTLGRSYAAYGWDAASIPAEVEVRVHVRPKVPRRSIQAVIMSYGIFEMSIADAEKSAVYPGARRVDLLKPNETTLAPDGVTVIRMISRFGDRIHVRTEPKQTRHSKFTCEGCHKRKLRKTSTRVMDNGKTKWFCSDCQASLNLPKFQFAERTS